MFCGGATDVKLHGIELLISVVTISVYAEEVLGGKWMRPGGWMRERGKPWGVSCQF